MSIAASGADARLRYGAPAICGCAVWTSGCVPAGLMMLGGKSRKPQKQG
ncbi:hypothetical protein SAZ11_32990 [Streptomyces sp. FXJ1.4098]|nr:hypothetical protein [Streptomyces sp. FXJ1.4098]